MPAGAAFFTSSAFTLAGSATTQKTPSFPSCWTMRWSNWLPIEKRRIKCFVCRTRISSDISSRASFVAFLKIVSIWRHHTILFKETGHHGDSVALSHRNRDGSGLSKGEFHGGDHE